MSSGVSLTAPLPAAGRTASVGATLGIAVAAALMAFVVALVQQPIIEARLSEVLVGQFDRSAIADPASFHGVIVLGGGDDRVREAGLLARRYPHLKIVITGAGRPEDDLALLGPGVDPGRVIFERQAKTTFQNAVFSKQVVTGETDRRWLVVTSDYHMPRAVGALRAAGFDVEGWPVASKGSPDAHAVWHEVFGLVAYRMLGRTDALLPGPLARDVNRPGTHLEATSSFDAKAVADARVAATRL